MGKRELWKNIGYTEKVVEHFMNPRNVGRLEDADIVTKVGSVVCGDLLKLYIKVDEKTHTIKDIKFESYGCASNIATTSVMTELVKGKTIEEAKKLGFKDIINALGGLPKIKYHCAALSKSGLETALLKYEVKKGFTKLDEKFVRRVLKGILDPLQGKDIVSLHKVDEVKMKGKKVEIKLNYSKKDESAKYISEDIKEAFSDLNVKITLKFKE